MPLRVEKIRRVEERERPSAYSIMADEALAAAIVQLELALDRADSLQEPAATAHRTRALESLTSARAEQDRRRC